MRTSFHFWLVPALALSASCAFFGCAKDGEDGTAGGGEPSGGRAGSSSGASSSGGSSSGANSSGANSSGASSIGAAGATDEAGAPNAGGTSSTGGTPNSGGSPNSGGAGGALPDECSGCFDQDQICIYQVGGPGPSHFACATQLPCGAAGACACIQGQGTCDMNLAADGYCHCDNGLD